MLYDDSPLAAGLVGQAYEDSFAKEDREIKRGTNTQQSHVHRKKVVVVVKSNAFRDNAHKRGLKSSQGKQAWL